LRSDVRSGVPHTLSVRVRVLVAVGVLVAGCSSTGCSASGGSGRSAAAARTPTTSSPTSSTTTSTTTSAAGSSPGAATADYVAAVNALCQNLLPKILAVTNDGDPAGFTVAQFKQHLAAHTALERDFDRRFAEIPVPPGARTANAAMRAYIAFADRVDARRLAAADRGQRAFVAEVHAEGADYLSSPVKAARDAAGFDSACDAR
jgi:hypothetical protein